jgi:Domain of unknown function (DUF4430)
MPRARFICSLLAAALVAGCGFGAGDEQDGGAELRVTRDFGREELHTATEDAVREDETVMRLLQSERDVETRYGGKFVQSIEGVEATAGGERRDWFYFVNGIEADKGAADYELSPGDVVQWDYRGWGATMRVPAIVGAFPEPFTSGVEGKKLPTRLECDESAEEACDEVRRRLSAHGVKTARATIGAPGTDEVLRVVVGRWSEVRLVREAKLLEEGPELSGVFARFAADGRSLELLDSEGTTRRAEPGTGVVAATRVDDRFPVWFVTATDAQGVAAAARLLDEQTLRNAFAVAGGPGGEERLPVGEEQG